MSLVLIDVSAIVAFASRTAPVDAQGVVAQDDDYTLFSGEALSIPAPRVLGNDTPLGATVVTHDPLSSLGNAVTVTSDGSLSLAPPGGGAATETFTYMIDDGAGNQDTATVTITANDGRVGITQRRFNLIVR